MKLVYMGVLFVRFPLAAGQGRQSFVNLQLLQCQLHSEDHSEDRSLIGPEGPHQAERALCIFTQHTPLSRTKTVVECLVHRCSLAVHVVLTFLFVEFTLLFSGRILVLLVLRDKIVHV